MKTHLRILLLLFWAVQPLLSQNFTSRVFSIDEGLPDSYVYSVLQDKEDFLWIATAKGLMKFDGQVFVKYAPEKETDDYIFSAASDRQGGLWFGTFGGKIYKLDKYTGRLVLFHSSIPGSISKIVASRKSDRLYFISGGNGVYVLEDNKLVNIAGTSDYFINALCEVDFAKLLLCTNEGLVSLDLKGNRKETIADFDHRVMQIQELVKKKNTYVVSTSDEGMYEIETDDQGISVVLKYASKIGDGVVREISAFYYNEAGNELYFGTQDEHFSVMDLATQKVVTFSDNEYLGLANSVTADREGNIWVSTTGRGLYRFYKTDYDFLSVNDEPVYAITQDSQGNTYCGTSNGVKITDPQGTIKSIEQLQNRQLGKITALYLDTEQHLWIGTENKGLFLVEQASLKPLPLEFSNIENIGINAITGFAGTNEVYVSTNLDGVYNYTSGKLKDHFSVQNSLLHNNVYYAARDKRDRVYYATHNTAFNFSIRDQVYEISLDNNDLISDYNAFARNSDGNLAIATDGDGVYMLSDTTITPCDFNDQLESKYCNGIIYDNDFDLWIVQHYNIYKYYVRDKILKKLSFGFNSKSFFNSNAVYKNETGDLFFGTNKNVVIVRNKLRKSASNLLPRSYLLNVKLGDTLIDHSRPLDLPYGRYDLSFEFSALSLKNSEQNYFRYKLEGRDDNWSEPTRSRIATFSNLTEGEYVFKVMSYNSEGFAEKEPMSFPIFIDAPFWKKAGFWIPLVIFIVILVFFIVRWRTAALVREKLRLERIVEEKTLEIRNEKGIVEKNSKVIEAQNHDITQSINYAKRIQEAILPVFERDGAYVPEIFVYYIPKDIVSGDFYWHVVKNDRFLIAACDCTGHGVPGAFMSLIGCTLLNKIVLDKGIVDPATILQEIDKEISISLKQESNEVRDGMETAVCSFDFKNNKLYYAGAKRPLWLFKNNGEKYVLTEYAPSKFPIGGFADIKEKPFIAHEIELHRQDTIYLFSDGIIDQFDGTNSKRLSTRRVREFLSTIVTLPMSRQEAELHKFFNDWRQANKQTDDVLVIGIRV